MIDPAAAVVHASGSDGDGSTTRHMRRAHLASGAAAIACAALALCGCADGQSSSPAAVASAPGCREQIVDLFHFGLDTPQGTLADAEWQRFLEHEITPRFPDGLTVLQAQGQWRGGDGRIAREPSRVVEIVHGGDPQTQRALAAIVARYKARYRQESVLRVRTRGEACF